MRVVAGAARGRRLVAPKGDAVRPTGDRVKEALFSSLQPVLSGAHVLDLFAGSGALGLEALSRGAEHVTFVERDRAALDALRRNVTTVGLPGAEVVAGPVTRVLTGEPAPPGAPFDLVVADPPYRFPDHELRDVLVALVDHLAEGAVVIVERDARSGPVPWPPQLQPGSPRRYGDTALHRADRAPGGEPDAEPG